MYVAEDVPRYRPPGQPRQLHELPEVFDYVVCAHTGNLVSELPRTMTANAGNVPDGWQVVPIDVTDELGRGRQITVIRNGAQVRLLDPHLGVYTHDFRFQDIDLQAGRLPGVLGEFSTPPPWVDGAISAHANAQDVARFFKEVLLRNGLDNLGGNYVSSICCCSVFNHGSQQEWHNAAWIGTQMVYGQRRVSTNGDQVEWRSYARAADVVAHEITHGLTSRTARLQYQGETGALNESYSDIFGMLVTNFNKPDRNQANNRPARSDQWSWELGREVSAAGAPLRDLAAPERGRPPQPAHVRDYVETDEDHGGVHTNSGIHNKAFHNLAMARDGSGAYLFIAQDLATLFYLALTQHLSRTSRFADSRRAVELVARTMFRNSPDDVREQRLAAVAQAFDEVGIEATTA